MARENPPTAPAAIAHAMLARSGNVPCCPSAIEAISAKAQACENAVKTNALARREPYPPAKSAAPHMKTATTEYAAGGSGDREDTPDEVNMSEFYGDRLRISQVRLAVLFASRRRGARATRVRIFTSILARNQVLRPRFDRTGTIHSFR